MDIKRSENIREFIAIEYPGRVYNEMNMIETLGGLQEISRSFQEKQKLQLKFHHKSFYNKAVISTEQIETTGMLLKIKTRRPKKKSPDKKLEFLSTEVVGIVSSIYKFNNIADYQYLPLQKNEKTGVTEYIYNDILPSNVLGTPLWFKEKLDVPLFLPPVQFSRSDMMMQPISLNNESKTNPENEKDEPIQFSITARSSRITHGTTIVFDVFAPVPVVPKESVKDMSQLSNTVSQKEFETLQKLFEERPIWTLSSLRAHIREPPKRLSSFLAGIAYYYTTGPWRNCFVRFGYDTRNDFESRFYQMIDYRVRQGAGFKGELKRKRTSAISKRVKVHQKNDGTLQESEIEENYQLRRKEAIFTEETIPPFRARHYQFADVHIDKIQEMLRSIPPPAKGTLCNEKRGWLPTGFLENTRDILTRIAQTNMMKLCKETNMSFEDYSKSETFDEADQDESISDMDVDDDDESPDEEDDN